LIVPASVLIVRRIFGNGGVTVVLRVLLLTGWLLIPVAGLAWHMGPGKEQQELDKAAVQLRAAEQAAAQEDYAAAVERYTDALKELPTNRTADARKIRLEKAKAQMLAKQLPEAHADLKTLVDELAADPAADPKVLAEARSTMANSNYYMTWLMRLEGLSAADWEPEIEAARQTYRLLAEQAEKDGDATAAKKHKEDLEAAVRLARLDLGELQGLPLPSQ
jgi:hypothetical protein